MKIHSRLPNQVARAEPTREVSVSAFDIALNFNARAHALVEFEIESLSDDDFSRCKIEAISSDLDSLIQTSFIDGQAKRMSTIVREPSASLLPYKWNTEKETWESKSCSSPTHNLEPTPANRSIILGMFVLVSNIKFLSFILTDVPCDDEQRTTDEFQCAASKLICEIVDTRRPSPTKIINASERSCLVWCANGKTSNEIATILSLSEHTVNHYFTLICTKLQATNRAHAVAKALKWGLISLDETA